jgi:hypothetical protein
MAGKFDVQTEIVDFVKNLFTHKDLAQKFASDPHGTLAEQGITDHDLSGVDMPKLIGDACGSVDLPADTRSVLQSYSSGSPAPSGGYSPPSSSYSSGVEDVVQHLNYATYVTYKDDHSITQEITDNSTNIDQHQNIDLSGADVDGDISVDQHDANALGDGSVAGSTGEGNVVGATGDGAQAVGDDNEGQMVSGTGNVTAGDDLDNSGALNTGTFTGVQAGDDADDSVVGDHNTVANVDGENEGTINFGGGDVTNVSDSTVTDSAIAGHDANNVSGNSASDGSAIGGRDASGSYSDSHDTTTTTNTTSITATNSQVENSQGNEGDTEQHQDSHIDVDLPHREPPVLYDHEVPTHDSGSEGQLVHETVHIPEPPPVHEDPTATFDHEPPVQDDSLLHHG